MSTFVAEHDKDPSSVCKPQRSRRVRSSLTALPEAAQGKILSYLTTWSGHALATASKSLHQCAGFSPASLRLASARQNNNVDRRRTAHSSGPGLSSLYSLLRRGGGVRGEVVLQNPSLLGPLCAALTAGYGRDIESLVINAYGFGEFVQSEAEEQQALGRALDANLLPRLKKLMLAHTTGAADRQPVWRALGNGACPLLETLRLPLRSNAQLIAVADSLERRATGAPPEPIGTEMSTKAPTSGHADIATATGSLAQTLVRPLASGSGCLGQIRSLEVLSDFGCDESAIDHRVMDRLLHCAVFSNLSSLSTTRSAPSVASFLAATQAPSLTRLHMSSHQGSGDDELLLALSGGAAPQLQHLFLEAYPTSPAAMDALCESMHTGGTLRHLVSLELAALGMMEDASHYLQQLFTAVGTSHGCPSLESVELHTIDQPGMALAKALEKGAMPQLRKIRLTRMTNACLTELCQSLSVGQNLPNRGNSSATVRPLAELHVGECGVGEEGGRPALQTLTQSLLTCPRLTGLRVLDLHMLTGVDAEALLPLADALCRGAGAALESLTVPAIKMGPHVGVEAVLEALANGACPHLRRLILSRREEEGMTVGSVTDTDAYLREQEKKLRATRLGESTGGAKDVYAAYLRVDGLVRILAGSAACSRSLQEVCVRVCPILAEVADALAQALCEPHAARLTALELSVGGSGVGGVLEIISALATWPSGSRLVRLHLALGEGMEEEDMDLVQEHVAQAMEEGAMPQMEGEDGVRVWREEDLWGSEQGWQRTKTILQTRRRVGMGV